jgi:hypothetical protein
VCLPLDPGFAGSDLAKDYRFLRVIKILSMTSFGGEVKLLVPCHKFLWHVKEPASMKEIICVQNSAAISLPSSPALLLDVFASKCQGCIVRPSHKDKGCCIM